MQPAQPMLPGGKLGCEERGRQSREFEEPLGLGVKRNFLVCMQVVKLSVPTTVNLSWFKAEEITTG